MRIYFGWYIVAISIVALALTLGASLQAFGLFVLPVSREFQLTRADFNTGAILFNIGMAVCGPLLGRLLDRHSARRMMMISALLLGMGLIVLGLSTSIWLSAAAIALPLAAAGVGCGTVTSPALVARWFTEHRGRAMAIAMLGVSLGPIVVVPLIGQLMEAVGWRQTLIIVGIVSGGIIFALALLVREQPGPDDHEVSIDRPREGIEQESGDGMPSLSIGGIVRLPQFWTICLSVALAFGIMQVVIISLVPYGQGEGLTLTQAASLISMYGGFSMLGALLFAWLGDRFNRLLLIVGLLLLFTVSGTSFLLATNYPLILVATAIFGLIGGMITPCYLSLLADRFGAASFGTATGSAGFVSTVISAACLRAGGEMYDRTGSYRLTFLSIAVVGTVAVLIMLATIPLTRTPRI